MSKAKIKICGMKTLQDIELANRYQPDYVGFVFAGTKRRVTKEQAFYMKRALDTRIGAVGVFVNEPMEHIISLCQEGIIDVVQLHGDESEEQVCELKQKIEKPVIRVVRVQNNELTDNSEQDKEVVDNELQENGFAQKLVTTADYILFDTYKQGVYGGSGERFSLELLQKELNRVKVLGYTIPPFWIAGGLTPENVTEVTTQTDCFGIDISSGVETLGKKDETKIRSLMRALR